MIKEKNKFLTVSWLSGLLSAEIFISTGEWGVQMPHLTAENSHFLRSGAQGAALVMIHYEMWNEITYPSGIAGHRGFASLTHSKSQSRIVVTSAAAHGRIVKTVKKVTTYMVGTVKRQNTSSSERSWRKIAETRQSLFRKSAWSGYAHKMCAVDSNTKRLYSNEMSDRATHFTVFMIMNCPVEQQIDFITKAHKNA